MLTKACERCLVYGTDGKPLAEARVVKQDDKKILLYFREGHFKDARVVLPVDFFDAWKGRIRTYSELVFRRNPNYMKESEYWVADCRIQKAYSVIQRQADMRVPVQYEEEFKSAKHGSFFGIIENISAGGFFVSTSQLLSKDEIISFRAKFLKSEWELEASTRWMRPMIHGKYGYGCRFEVLPRAAEAKIRSLVYQIQIQKEREEN